MAVKYRKQKPEEIIETGHVVMISPETSFITKAQRDPFGINERLVVGVANNTDNSTPVPIEFRCGNAKEVTALNIDGGNSSSSNTLNINGGNSLISSREYIDTVEYGIVTMTIDIPPCTRVRVGDKLAISRKNAGNVEVMRVTNNHPFGNRSIGKVIKIIDGTHVEVLLNIE